MDLLKNTIATSLYGFNKQMMLSADWRTITQEKRMKKWKREYKENVIREMNPEWKDLYNELV